LTTRVLARPRLWRGRDHDTREARRQRDQAVCSARETEEDGTDSVVQVKSTFGPDPVVRYNGFPAADLVGQADPTKMSSAHAIAAVAAAAPSAIPPGLTYEWTDLSFQQVSEGRGNLIVFPLAILRARRAR
jgi:multidrug efflux pump subunit AcrB